jgi:hypothetical protein
MCRGRVRSWRNHQRLHHKFPCFGRSQKRPDGTEKISLQNRLNSSRGRFSPIPATLCSFIGCPVRARIGQHEARLRGDSSNALLRSNGPSATGVCARKRPTMCVSVKEKGHQLRLLRMHVSVKNKGDRHCLLRMCVSAREKGDLRRLLYECAKCEREKGDPCDTNVSARERTS